MTLIARAPSAGSFHEPREIDAVDPVLEAIRRARRALPLPEEERARLLALDAEVTSDPRIWQSTEALLAKLATLRVVGAGDDALEDDDE